MHSWVGDSSLRKGLLFTEHFRGKPCRIHKTGYNVKMILGIDWGVGGYIFVALILMIKATNSRFFSSPLGNIIYWAIFFFFLPKLICG